MQEEVLRVYRYSYRERRRSLFMSKQAIKYVKEIYGVNISKDAKSSKPGVGVRQLDYRVAAITVLINHLDCVQEPVAEVFGYKDRSVLSFHLNPKRGRLQMALNDPKSDFTQESWERFRANMKKSLRHHWDMNQTTEDLRSELYYYVRNFIDDKERLKRVVKILKSEFSKKV